VERVILYSDESGHKGQDIRLFTVAGVAISAHANVIKQKLVRAEKVSGKGTSKWQKTKSHQIRRHYLEEVLKIQQLNGCAFQRPYEGEVNAFEATADALRAAVEEFAGNKHCVLVHQGFNAKTRTKLRDELRRAGIDNITVESGSMENEPRVRLADALAGFAGLIRSDSHIVDIYNGLPYEGWFVELA